MGAVPSQPALFAGCEPARTDAQPAGTPARGKRGRGATPVYERVFTLDKPNASGRYKLTYRFRPLQRHEEPAEDFDGKVQPRWKVACRLLYEYFVRLGGFQTVDDETARKWGDALDAHTARELLCAIVEKAKSLQGDDAQDTRDKRVYAVHPSRFVDACILEQWLDRSDEARRIAAAHDRQRIAPALDDIVAKRIAGTPAAAPRPVAPPPNPDELAPSDAELAALPPFVQEAAREYARNERFLDGLSEQQRVIVFGHLKANKADYRTYLDSPHAAGDPWLRGALRASLAVRVALQRWPELLDLWDQVVRSVVTV